MTSDLMRDVSLFLNSSATTAEWMPDELRKVVTIKTGLEEIVEAALSNSRSVVIAGTAGSGKTHLLRMAGHLPKKYRVVPDLAAHVESGWAKLFTDSTPVIVAGNEGAFLNGVRKNLSGFDQVVESLHSIQKGEEHASKGPVVIDAAGYDPAGNHAIARILRLPILAQYVETKSDPLARDAWQMLSDERICKRVALLVETASAHSSIDGFTFRQLWQFVADLIEGNLGSPVPWFQRVFRGTSEVSTRISECFSPTSLALAHVGSHLWHLDLDAIRDQIIESAIPVFERLMPSNGRDETLDVRRARYSLLRELAVFALKAPVLERRLERPTDLWTQIRKKEPIPLLRAINHYMTYGLLGLGQDLELWIQHDTERREVKPGAQISLGTATSDEFSLRRSVVVANRPATCDSIEGGRLLLVHKASGAALSISKDLVDALLKGRSHRTKDRRDVEYDWRLSRFFSEVSAKAGAPDNLKVALFNFQSRAGEIVKWQVKGAKLEKAAV